MDEKENSIQEDLENALKQFDGEVEVEAKEAKTAEADTEAKKTVEDADKPAYIEEKDEASTKAEPQPIGTPTSWSKEYKDEFVKLPLNIQKYILDRDKETNTKISTTSQKLKELQEFEGIIEQNKDLHQMIGKRQWVTNLAQADRLLRTDFKTAINKIFELYGKNPNDVFGQTSQQQSEFLDPEVEALANEVRALKQERQAEINNQRQTTYLSAQGQINDFASKLGDDGNPAHPYFENVKELMGVYMEKNNNYDLDAAYNAVIYSIPEYRQQAEERLLKEREIVKMEEAKKKVSFASNASSSLKPNASKRVASPEMDLRELIASQM